MTIGVTDPPATSARAVPLRVGFVTVQLDWGGAERQLFFLARGLAERGDRVGVACLSDLLEPYGPALARGGVEVRVFGRSGSWDVRRLFALRKWLAESRPEVLCAFGEFAGVYAHFARVGLSGRPRLVTMLRRGSLSLPRIKLSLVRYAFRHADAVGTNSEAGRLYGARYLGLSPERTFVLRNALPQDVLDARVDRDAVRASLGIKRDERVVAYVGRAANAKDIPTLCRTLTSLGDRLDRWRALVIGPGLERPPDGLPDPGERVMWLGLRSDALSLMGASDVVLLTSRSEGLPNVVLEAMALARPVVSTAVGDVEELLRDGPAGRVAPVGDHRALSEALAGLLRSPAACAAMGGAGRARAEAEFGLERILEQFRLILSRSGEIREV